MPFADRTALALYAVNSNTDVAALGTLSVLGNGQIFGVRAIQTLPDGIDLAHSVSYGVEYKDFLEDIRLDADNQLQTPISYVNWSVAYNGTLRGESAVTGFNTGVSLGVRGVVNDEGIFADKRYRGKPNYLVLRAGLQHTRELPGHLQLFGRIGAQYSPDALVSNEQFVLGGVDTVRGYLESTLLGDYGVNASVELRHAGIASLLKLAPSAAHVYVFYDGGIAAIHYPLPQQQQEFRLGSLGLGLRITDWHGVSLGLDWAHVLSRPGASPIDASRLHFGIRYSF
jgi:hemolysin activation/secretion protein